MAFLKLTTPRKDVLNLIIVILLVRLCYDITGSYSSVDIPDEWKNRAIDLEFTRPRKVMDMTVRSLLEKIKMNTFVTDKFTLKAAEILKAHV